MARGDAGRLRQVIINLVDNAIKFTDSGSVSVDVRREAAREGDMQLHISVQDTGIGIPAERHRGIFDAFAQADASTTRRFGGTGLGLAISARLVTLMGGEIDVRSEPGHGSTFHFTVTLHTVSDRDAAADAAADRTSTDEESPAVATGLRILVAEDNFVNQRLAAALLERRGHQVVVASNGLEALHALESQSFDLALMDIQMPGMGGMEVVAQIRAREAAAGGHLPIIAVTAHAMAGDRELCLEAGMDAYLPKPLRQSDLYALIDAIMTDGAGEAAAPPVPVDLRLEELLNVVEGDAELLRSLASIFLEDADTTMSQIREYISSGDAAALAGAAHRLKGAAAVFGAADVVAAAQVLEGLGRSGELSAADAACDQLERRLVGLTARLNAVAAH
jgi:CheY-like chemotaxis protein/anti-sigma regulatory factor (Ser/Thr protein kinase)